MKLKFRTPWILSKDETSTHDSHAVVPSTGKPSLALPTLFKKKQMRAACALNMCMVSLSQIVDYQDLEILKMEYDSVLNNLNLEKVVKDESLLKALQAIMDACHFYILHAKEKEILKKKQQARLKSALGNAIGGGNVIAIFGKGNPWAIAAGAAAMIGVAAVNYKSQRDKAKLENEIDEWQLERSALEQLHNLRRTLFETAWRFAEKYNYPDFWRLTEKQISVYNEIIRIPDPLTRYENLLQIKDNFEAYPNFEAYSNFEAYPIFWYSLGRAALETSDAYRPDAGEGERKRVIAYGDGDKSLQEKYRGKALEAYAEFTRRHRENNLMREDVIAASAYLDHAQLCDSSTREGLANILKDTDSACKLAPMDEEILQSCAFRYLQLYAKSEDLRDWKGPDGQRKISDAVIGLIPKNAEKCLRFLLDRDFNPEVNGRALSLLYTRLYEATDDKNKKEEYFTEYRVVKSMVSRRCPLVYNRLIPWDEDSFRADWDKYLNGDGLKTTAYNLFYGINWMRYKDFLCALYEAKKTRNYKPLKDFRDHLPDESTPDKVTFVTETVLGLASNEENWVSKEENFVWGLVKDVVKTFNASQEDKELTVWRSKLLDESYERDGWKLFLGTRVAEYSPTEFEKDEKALMEELISVARNEALEFVSRVRKNNNNPVRYEDLKSGAEEPMLFRSLSDLEWKAERLRLEIQELLQNKGLLGVDSRFWYPVPKFQNAALPDQLEEPVDVTSATPDTQNKPEDHDDE
jgi:hypothetical protein